MKADEIVLDVFQDLVRKHPIAKRHARFSSWLIQPQETLPWEAVSQHVLFAFCGKHPALRKKFGEIQTAIDSLVNSGDLVRGTAEEFFPHTFEGPNIHLVICSPKFAQALREHNKIVHETLVYNNAK